MNTVCTCTSCTFQYQTTCGISVDSPVCAGLCVLPSVFGYDTGRVYTGIICSSGLTYCMCLVTSYTPPHNRGGVLWFHIGRPCVCQSSVSIAFLDDNLSKHQWIFTKLNIYIDIVEIWFGIDNGQIFVKGVICPRHAHGFVSRQ